MKHEKHFSNICFAAESRVPAKIGPIHSQKITPFPIHFSRNDKILQERSRIYRKKPALYSFKPVKHIKLQENGR
jgi:hypothetical protein